MNNSLLRSAFATGKNSVTSYLRSFKVAQINFELNKQEDHINRNDKLKINATLTKRWHKTSF